MLLFLTADQNLSAQQKNPFSIMKGVVNNHTKLIFEGEQTSIFLSNKEAIATIAKVYRHGKKERLEYIAANPHPYHVIISDDINTYYLQHDNNVLIEKNFEEETNLDMNRIELAFKNYEWKFVRQENFIGKNADVIEAVPYKNKDGFYRFWVDTKNKLILKKERYDKKGQLSLTTQFTTIKFVKSLPEKLFAVETIGKIVQKQHIFISKKISTEDILNHADFVPKIHKELPQGFLLEGVYMETNKGKQRLRFAYSDGLESISLFETKQTANRSKKTMNMPQNNKTNSVNRAEKSHWKMLSWNDDYINYILVGTINSNALEQIAVFINGNDLNNRHGTGNTKKIFNYFKRGLKQLFGCYILFPGITPKLAIC